MASDQGWPLRQLPLCNSCVSFLEGPYLLSSYLSSIPATALPYLDNLLDWDQEGVDRHLNRIADAMIEWEENLSIWLGLTEVQIHDLKKIYSQEPVLLRHVVSSITNPYTLLTNCFLYRRAVLRKWKTQHGLRATYRMLLKVCCEGGDCRSAATICEVLKEKAFKAARDGMDSSTVDSL